METTVVEVDGSPDAPHNVEAHQREEFVELDETNAPAVVKGPSMGSTVLSLALVQLADAEVLSDHVGVVVVVRPDFRQQ